MTTTSFGDAYDHQSSTASAEGTCEYQVQNMSNWSIFIFVLAAPLSVFLAVAGAMAFGGSAVAFAVSIPVIVVLMILLFRSVHQKILVTVGQGTINIRYQRSPFYDAASDIDITPDDVESYKFDNFNGVRFTLYLKDGRRFRTAVGSTGKTKAIELMAEHIIALLNDVQHSTTGSVVPPRRRATYAEGTKGLIFAFVAIAAIIAMGIAIIFFPENHTGGDTVRGIGVMCTCLAFVLHVFNLRRKARKKREQRCA